MKGKLILVLLSLLLIGSVVLAACAKATPKPAATPVPAATPAPTAIKWKMATSWPKGMHVLQEGAEYLAARINEASGGRLVVDVFPAGALVGGLELFDATTKGTIQMGHGAAGYQEGKFPAASFFSAIPFSPTAEGYTTWLFEGGGLELWNEVYAGHNIVVMPGGLIGPEMTGWYRKPIKSLDDYKGMKIRFFGLGGKMIAKLGASVVLMPGGELYLALQRGVIDATEFSMPAIDEGLGLFEVAKYYTYPGWHQQTSTPELLIHKPSWDALPKDLQAIIRMASRDAMLFSLNVGEKKNGPALERMKAKGITLITLPPEEMSKLRKVWDEVKTEEAAKDPMFAKVAKSWDDFMAQYGGWFEISQLKTLK